jgi:hypothetical protein
MMPADPVGDMSMESRSVFEQEDDLTIASTGFRADELAEVLMHYALDPTIAFDIFPAGPGSPARTQGASVRRQS